LQQGQHQAARQAAPVIGASFSHGSQTQHREYYLWCKITVLCCLLLVAAAGPGVGKGRQIAATIFNYFCRGKTKVRPAASACNVLQTLLCDVLQHWGQWK
jgi:hypothetical protein